LEIGGCPEGLVTLFNNPKCFLVKILPASADRHSTLTFLVSFPRNYYKRLRSTPPFCSQHHNFCPYSPIDGRVREKRLASSTQRHMSISKKVMSDKNIIHNSTSLTQVPTAITADNLPGMLLICTDFDSAILFQSTPVETVKCH
jgi:hypothetical protein